MNKHLLTLYTRTPLHVGCGTSVDVVDLPIMRERISHFPVIPGSSLKGVLLQAAREHFENGTHARSKDGLPAEAKLLFGAIDSEGTGDGKKQIANAGCVQIMEAKLLAFPVRSLAGCFAWLTCPTALERFQRDTGTTFTIPKVAKDHVIAGSELLVDNQVVLEEYALDVQQGESIDSIATALAPLTDDPLWQAKHPTRLAIVHDENFQHFVTTCTEVVARIVLNPATRTNTNLFNQENVPCEALFYTVLSVLSPRRQGSDGDANSLLTDLLKANPTLQIGGDETTGHGLCETLHKTLPLNQPAP